MISYTGLHKLAWFPMLDCVSLHGQAGGTASPCSATDLADLGLDFGPPGLETPTSSYPQTVSKRHCVVSALFPVGSVSPFQKTALSLSASPLPLFEMHSWSSWPISASAPLWIWSLNHNHLANPALVIWSLIKSCVFSHKFENAQWLKCHTIFSIGPSPSLYSSVEPSTTKIKS